MRKGSRSFSREEPCLDAAISMSLSVLNLCSCQGKRSTDTSSGEWYGTSRRVHPIFPLCCTSGT